MRCRSSYKPLKIIGIRRYVYGGLTPAKTSDVFLLLKSKN